MADQQNPLHQTVQCTYASSSSKRAYDVVLATFILVATFPILIPVILVNAVVARGNPIFVQSRVGLRGVEFRLFKLKTMRTPKNGEKWSHRTAVGDDRLTFVGKLLRRTYIDELPQLVNVIFGQMSMIGPRPETLETTNVIARSHPRFVERLTVKPGISGAAQVFFRKPMSEDDLWRRYYYDHIYVARNSLSFDVQLTVLTAWHVFRNKGH